MIEVKELFDLSRTQAADYLSAFRYPWEALDGIKQMILDLGEKLPADEYEQRAEGVWVHKTAKVFPSAYLGLCACRCELCCRQLGRTEERHSVR